MGEKRALMNENAISLEGRTWTIPLRIVTLITLLVGAYSLVQSVLELVQYYEAGEWSMLVVIIFLLVTPLGFGAALLFCLGVPFLLPHMHDRYFFVADILTVVLAVSSPVFIPAALCVNFGSLLGYHAYLKMRYLLPMRYGAVANVAALALVLIYTAMSMRKAPETPAPDEVPPEPAGEQI